MIEQLFDYMYVNINIRNKIFAECKTNGFTILLHTVLLRNCSETKLDIYLKNRFI